MGEVIVITSGKGGVGKTTTTANIGIGLSSAGKKVLVIDKRNHIAGNIYTENVEGINVHKYGAHIFHTSDKIVWDYVNQFAEFKAFNYEYFV